VYITVIILKDSNRFVLQPPPATGLKSNWNGVPVPFFSNASYSCAKSTTFFLADRNLEAWNLTCLPGGVWQTPVWPSCVTSRTSTSRIKQGVDFQTSVRGRKGKEGKVFSAKNTRIKTFFRKKHEKEIIFFCKNRRQAECFFLRKIVALRYIIVQIIQFWVCHKKGFLWNWKKISVEMSCFVMNAKSSTNVYEKFHCFYQCHFLQWLS
jgi:hypothetical protein